MEEGEESSDGGVVNGGGEGSVGGSRDIHRSGGVVSGGRGSVCGGRVVNGGRVIHGGGEVVSARVQVRQLQKI